MYRGKLQDKDAAEAIQHQITHLWTHWGKNKKISLEQRLPLR